MPDMALAKRVAAVAASGLLAGLVTGALLPARPRPVADAAVMPRDVPGGVAPRPAVAPPSQEIADANRSPDPIGALAAQATGGRTAAPNVAWTSGPQRVERREPTASGLPPRAPLATAPAAAEQPAGAAATRASALAGDLPEGPRATYTRLEVVDGGSFRAVGRVIRIAGVEALPLDETCRDAQGASWPCGRRAQAALRDLVRQRSVQCVEVGEGAARCRVGRTDLSAWLVEQGWARPSAGEAQLATLHEDARSQGAGLFTRNAVQR